jgi:hypothetical protein
MNIYKDGGNWYVVYRNNQRQNRLCGPYPMLQLLDIAPSDYSDYCRMDLRTNAGTAIRLSSYNFLGVQYLYEYKISE